MRRLPRLLLDQWFGFGNLSTLRFVAVFYGAASGGPFGIRVQRVCQRIHQDASAWPSQHIADIKGHAIGADHRHSGSVAESDGIFMVDESSVEHRAYDARITMRRDANAGRETRFDGELGGVFASDEKTPLFNELLQMR